MVGAALMVMVNDLVTVAPTASRSVTLPAKAAVAVYRAEVENPQREE